MRRSAAGMASVCFCVLAACSTAPHSGPSRATPAAALRAAPAVLPPPSSLIADLPAELPKVAALTAADLMRPGEGFASGLPNQRVAATAGGALFSPAGAGFGGLSFAMYSFDVTGYTGAPAMHLLWNGAAPGPADHYLALANWDTGHWDFYTGVAGGSFILPSLVPYTAFGGGLLTCVLCSGTAASELDRLRIGGLPPLARITSSTVMGIAPLDVTLSAELSTDPDGDIAEYRWDPEGDGNFSVSTGTVATLDWTYAQGGELLPAVRVIDADGLTDESAIRVLARSSGDITWGGPDYWESWTAALGTNDFELLLFGGRTPQTGSSSMTFTLFNHDGTVKVAREWSGSGGAVDARLGAGDTCYAISSTRTHGILTRWTQDGALLWARGYSHAAYNVNFSAMGTDFAHLYVCGTMDAGNDYNFAFVTCLDLDGEVAWSRALYPNSQHSRFQDIAVHSNVDTELHCCGAYNYAANSSQALYACFDGNGNLLNASTWGESDHSEIADAITLVGGGFDIPSVLMSQFGTADSRAAFSQVGGAVQILAAVSTYSSGVDLLHLGAGRLAFSLREFEGGVASCVIGTASLDFTDVTATHLSGDSYMRIGRYNEDPLFFNQSSATGFTATPVDVPLQLSPAAWSTLTPVTGSEPLVVESVEGVLSITTGAELNRGAVQDAHLHTGKY